MNQHYQHYEQLKELINKISEVAQQNDLQLINSDGILVLQPKCYLYTEPDNKDGLINICYDSLMVDDRCIDCTSYTIGSMEHPEWFKLLDSMHFKCITHYYYLKVKRVLRECKKLQDYMVSNGISILDYEMEELGYSNISSVWDCWTPKDTPVYVVKLISDVPAESR